MDNYKKAFENYLKLTDEKERFFGYLSAAIQKFEIKSILDIGAGNGDLAIPLSKAVEKYVAVERNKNFIEALESKNLEVIQRDFLEKELPIQDKFDLVLCSYVIPHEDSFEEFVSKAFHYVDRGGQLIIITHTNPQVELGNFCEHLGLENEWDDPSFSPRIIKFLSSLGRVKQKNLSTEIISDNLEDLFLALSFGFSIGSKEKEDQFFEKKDEAFKFLEKNYSKGEKYVFPFKHEIIHCKKT